MSYVASSPALETPSPKAMDRMVVAVDTVIGPVYFVPVARVASGGRAMSRHHAQHHEIRLPY